MPNFYQHWLKKIKLNQNYNSVAQEQLKELIATNYSQANQSPKFWETRQDLNLSPIKYNYHIWDFVESILRGIGQVVLVNNPFCGLIILLALLFQSPWIASLILVGVFTSTFTAISLNLNQNKISNGIYGCNGVLIGAAIANFGLQENTSGNFFWIVPTIIFAIMTTIMLNFLGNGWAKRSTFPPLTLPFNLMTIIFLIWSTLVLNFDFGGYSYTISNNLVATSLDPIKLWSAIFIGFGQIFFANKLIVGFLIFIAIALYSPIGAFLGVVGAIVSLLTSLVLRVEMDHLYLGLSCYNSILGAMAIGGIFYAFNKRSFSLAVVCAALTAIIGQVLTILLEPLNLPLLHLPFCLATILMVVVLKRTYLRQMPLSLYAFITPEKHRILYLDARNAIAFFRFQLEGFMLEGSSNFWFNQSDKTLQTNLSYIFGAIDIKQEKQITLKMLEEYLEQTGQVYSRENIRYLARFIDPYNSGKLDYQQFSELILRNNYLSATYPQLVSYLLPLDKYQYDVISDAEINQTIVKTGHIPLTKMQIKLLHKRTGVEDWTWSQFVKVILAI